MSEAFPSSPRGQTALFTYLVFAVAITSCRTASHGAVRMERELVSGATRQLYFIRNRPEEVVRQKFWTDDNYDFSALKSKLPLSRVVITDCAD
jgi:hypothetical protein